MDTVLSQVTVPLLVLQSTFMNTQRQRVPLRAGESTPWLDLVRQYHPQAQMEIMPDVGHFPMLEVPEAVNQAILAFVEGLRQA
jgi:pimeloyl-ACP methyl ester carboxylesterase